MIESIPVMKGMPKYHDWQRKMASVWNKQTADKWGVRGLPVEAITGTGKTLASIICAKMWFKEKGNDARLVVVVPTEPLLKQWFEYLRRCNIANVSKQGGGRHYDGFAPIAVVIQNSLKRIKSHPNFKGKKVLYILDEAHRCAAKNTLLTLKQIRQAQEMQGCIAISATLKRADGNCIMDLTGYKKDKDGNRIPYLKYGYDKAVADGVIPPFRIHIYETTETDLTFAEYNELEELNKTIAIFYNKCKNHDKVNITNLFSHHNTGIHCVEVYRNLTRKRKRLINNLGVRYEIAQDLMLKHGMKVDEEREKGVIFHETIEGIEKIAATAIEAGLDKPYIYHSGEQMDWEEATHAEIKRYKEYAKNRKKILAQWVDPRTEDGLLLTCKSLKEGLDVPEMDFLIMLSHPNNATPLIQATGRALRGNKNKKGQWVNRHGVVIDEDNPKNIYIVVQAGTTDANCIPNMKKEGSIPNERFITYRRQGSEWVSNTGISSPHSFNMNDTIDDEFGEDDMDYKFGEDDMDDEFGEDDIDYPTCATHLAVIGWRDMTDATHFNATLDDYIMSNGTPTTIISGGQTGADTLARKYAEANGITFIEHSHMTYAHMGSPKMYHHRNQLIVNDATHMVAFPYPHGSGTQSCMKRANKKGIPIASFNPTPALEFNATTGEMQPATSAHIGGITNE
jgi:superfamily II DNA or RNA helicase